MAKQENASLHVTKGKTKAKRPHKSLEELGVNPFVYNGGNRRHTQGPVVYEAASLDKIQAPHSTRYVYVNEAYSGSVSTITAAPIQTQSTGVVREQYWACGRWPKTQRVLAVSVGILLGAVIGLAITMGLRAAGQENALLPVFRNHVAN